MITSISKCSMIVQILTMILTMILIKVRMAVKNGRDWYRNTGMTHRVRM